MNSRLKILPLDNPCAIHDATQKRYAYISKKLNHKLVPENAILVPADNGKSIVIIYSDDYSNKLHIFLTEHIFQTLQENPTDKYQKLLLKTLQQSHLIINKKQIKHLIQKNPKPPTTKAQLKMHKPDNPIRPIINNMKASSYKIDKHLVNKRNGYLCLNNQYSVKNTTSPADELTKLKINEHHTMVT
jgi:hypothetical protein